MSGSRPYTCEPKNRGKLTAGLAEFEALKQRIEGQLRGTYALGSVCVDYPGPSIGWVLSTGQHGDAGQLIEESYRAMYQAKRSRKPR